MPNLVIPDSLLAKEATDILREHSTDLLFNHTVELVDGIHVVVFQEFAELLGTLDILDDLVIVVEMVLVAVQCRE